MPSGKEIHAGVEKQDVKGAEGRVVHFNTACVSCVHSYQDLALFLFDLLQFITAVKIGMKICIPPGLE